MEILLIVFGPAFSAWIIAGMIVAHGKNRPGPAQA